MSFTKIVKDNYTSFGNDITIKQNELQDDSTIFSKVHNSKLKFDINNDPGSTVFELCENNIYKGLVNGDIVDGSGDLNE